MKIFFVNANLHGGMDQLENGRLPLESGREVNIFPTKPKPPIAFQYLLPIVRARGWPARYLALRTMVLDGQLDPECLFDTWRRWVAKQGPAVWAFTVNAQYYPTVIHLSKTCKEASSDNIVLHGGPQATAAADEAIRRFPWINIVVLGEGEEALPAILDRLDHGQSLRGLAGVAFRDQDGVVQVEAPKRHQTLHTLPFPDYSFTSTADWEEGPRRRHMLVETGRGCSFHCKFCTAADTPVRSKTIGRVVAEIERAEAHFNGLHQVTFVSNGLFATQDAIRAFSDTYRLAGLTIPWGSFARIGALPSATLEAMSAANCCVVHYGLETGSPIMQEVIGKHIRIDRAFDTVKRTLAAGMCPTVNFIIGFPEETAQTLNESLEVMLAMRLLGAKIYPTILSAHLGTRYHREYADKLLPNPYRRAEVFFEEDWTLIQRHPDLFSYFFYVPPQQLSIGLLESIYFIHIDRILQRMPELLDKALDHFDRDHLNFHAAYMDWAVSLRSMDDDHATDKVRRFFTHMDHHGYHAAAH